ncbi:hypothetical protein AGABI1DRAFT_61185 [Agaricus bisporus var. burnettii JB137-S8]|uniref:Zn(2)-C6 fungal-type domain-containing protein n=1 Tax=Agaricus bisporus var. burnettii (strain JB137-S8 / ATCC MYA-4627 / FGSC 10392) TaxID=597362 RepID=K5XT33_AGABU|nr:uncharacterized protein AGABI1DRAFT_61185 [Agaricus bisporus var. burnettii JB137-S8]EKM78150.1 hypothetical protein AGABI1DRAFT_61185 [Agaricus bisporus var. burnettii JB137-S8]
MIPNPLGGQNGAQPPSSLQSALQMDQRMQLQQGMPPASGPLSSNGSAPKRRRRPDDDGGGGGGAEPRRLRRSHEACARCRSKKIKCDSKHPRCTACATAGTVCEQEDRHRQKLTPRGLTMRMEQMLAQCEALLKHFVQDFDINRLDEFLARQGIDPNSITAANLSADFQIQEGGAPRPFQIDGPPNQQQPSPKAYPIYHGPPMLPPYPHHMMHYPGPYPPPLPPHMQGPPGLYPPFPGPYGPPPAHPGPLQAPPPTSVPIQEEEERPSPVTKGTDPNGNDLSSPDNLARNFGVSSNIVVDLKLASDREDLAVGYHGLLSGRDRSISESMKPREPAHWVALSLPRNSGTASHTLSLTNPAEAPPSGPSITIWLPKDRVMLTEIVDVYFKRLNIHRPVYLRRDFDKILKEVYDETTVPHDPGHICSIYLVLALGTLSELNHRAVDAELDKKSDAKALASAQNLMPPDWPTPDEFFTRALSIKPDLRVSISSLQALILLHWYLYTERQGRTLWRLVGSFVRLSIELGLHHDPMSQYVASSSPQGGPMVPLFSEEECQLRIRLWGIVLIHDRGTSILLGRPLAISPSDTNTPPPVRTKSMLHDDFSEHFELSGPVANFQADVINSLYTPQRLSADTIMRNATRIIKSMVEFRKGLPEKYKYYFCGTEDWPTEKKSKLVQTITEDEGLTLLKLGIARILLLRALFSSAELALPSRHKALIDAIITSHNIIVIHNQLISSPDVGFFTSPIPLHIAAMVILFGHMSKCETLPRQTALEDLWMALDMIPRFRWRWERRDAAGGHPLIARLVERVMNVDLHSIGPATHPVLIPEPDWDEDSMASPRANSSQNTPTISHTGYGQGGPVSYSNVQRPMNGAPMGHVGSNTVSGNTPPGKRLVDMPPGLFYPFYPEAPVNQETLQGNGHPPPQATQNEPHSSHDYSHLLAAAAAAQDESYHPTSFISEERTPPPQGQTNVWMSQGPSRQNVAQFVHPQGQ